MVHYDKLPAIACKPFEEDLVLYYYDELDSPGRAAVESHVKSCEPCRSYLKEMQLILPLTVKPDEPPQAFWEEYSREMRRKLAQAGDRKSWWHSLTSFLQPLGNSARCHRGCGGSSRDLDSRKGILGLQRSPPGR